MIDDMVKVIDSIKRARNWMQDANCKNMDTSLFFIEKNESIDPFVAEVCSTCPVIEECLWYANETHSSDGYFAGLTPRQRIKWRVENGISLGMSKKEYEGGMF